MAQTQKVRIIGGRFRGRNVSFVAEDGLRPTPDRVRETLFNWLAPVMAGACCLDACAGSGVLGIEALSRGASTVVFVDQSKVAIKRIQSHLATLDVQEKGQAMVGTMPHVALNQSFDVVFLDPPYSSDLIVPCLNWLISKQLLKPNGMVYVESDVAPDDWQWPSGWQVHRHRRAGAVHAYLLRYGV